MILGFFGQKYLKKSNITSDTNMDENKNKLNIFQIFLKINLFKI